MKKISFGLTKSAAWIAAGLMIGAGVGTGVGFLIINLSGKSSGESFGKADTTQNALINDRNIKIEEFPTNNARESIFGSKTDYTLSDNRTRIQLYTWNSKESKYEYSNTAEDGRQYSIVDLGLYTLAYKIKTRLGFGPEIAQLKGIRITPEGVWEEANGVYFGGTNEIFVNSTNIIDALKRAQSDLATKFNKEQEVEFVSEYVFQIIAHEYNHHIAYSYLNSRFKDDPLSSVKFFNSDPTQVAIKDSKTPATEAWDNDFYETFVKTLNYDGSDTSKDKKFLSEMSGVNDQGQYGKIVKPISKYFTSSDIFKYANDANVNSVHHVGGNGTNAATWDHNSSYSFFKDSQYAVIYTEESLKYNFSLAELFARKMQQLSMPTGTNFADLPSGEKYPIERYRNAKLQNANGSFGNVEEEIFGIDQLVWGTNRKGAYSPFILDTKNYADNWMSIPFTSDYLYSYDPQTKITDFTNATKIYTAMLQEMGYSGNDVKDFEGHTSNLEQADISAIWWKNDSTINKKGEMPYPLKTNWFSMGGFINDKNIKSIGYMKGTEYTKLADVTINNFTYGMKKDLISNAKYPLKYTVNDNGEIINENDQYFWTLEKDKYFSIKDFIGHDLVFETLKTEDDFDYEINNSDDLIQKMDQLRTDPNNKYHVVRASHNPGYDEARKTIIAGLNPIKYIPLTTYNSEATTWLSSNSKEQRSWINEQIARPHYGVDNQGKPTYGIRLQLFDKDNKEVTS